AGTLAAVATRPDGAAGGQWPELLATLPTLYEQAQRRPRGQLQVHTEPVAAAIELAGWQLGPAPLVRASFAGEYELTARAPGFQPEHRRVRVEAGQLTALSVPLLPLPVAMHPGALQQLTVWQVAPRPRW